MKKQNTVILIASSAVVIIVASLIIFWIFANKKITFRAPQTEINNTILTDDIKSLLNTDSGNDAYNLISKSVVLDKIERIASKTYWVGVRRNNSVDASGVMQASDWEREIWLADLQKGSAKIVKTFNENGCNSFNWGVDGSKMLEVNTVVDNGGCGEAGAVIEYDKFRIDGGLDFTLSYDSHGNGFSYRKDGKPEGSVKMVFNGVCKNGKIELSGIESMTGFPGIVTSAKLKKPILVACILDFGQESGNPNTPPFIPDNIQYSNGQINFSLPEGISGVVTGVDNGDDHVDLTVPLSLRELLTYTDRVAGYSVRFPEGMLLGVPTESGNQCSPVEKNINENDFPYFSNEDCGKVDDIEIHASKNALGMSAIDFAKQSVRLTNALDKDIVSEDRETIIGGVPAYEFHTQGSFYEFGRYYDQNNISLAETEPKSPNIGRTFTGRVIYLDHNGHIISIMFEDTQANKNVIESLKFF